MQTFIHANPSAIKSTAKHSALPTTFHSPRVGEREREEDDEDFNDASSLPRLHSSKYTADGVEKVNDVFTPFTLIQDRAWSASFKVCKQLSVKRLSDQLKVVIDRGITASAFGEPRLVTPLPKLMKR